MLYDLFVIGARDPSPLAQMHLAAKLAERFHAPAAQIAQAIATRNLRAGKSLDDAQARVLQQQLAGLGAETELRPALESRASGDPRKTSTVTAVAVASPSSQTLPTLPTTQVSPGAPTMAPAPGTDVVGRDPFAGLAAAAAAASTTGVLPTIPAGPGFGLNTSVSSPPSMAASGVYSAVAGFGGGHGGPPTLGRDPFRPPDDTGVRTAGRDPFAPPDVAAGSLQLARPPKPVGRVAPKQPGASDDEFPSAQSTLGGAAAGLDLGKTLAADSSLESVGIEGAKTHMVRCPKHGLYFDQRSASGCRKCLEPAKQLARKIERNSVGFKLLALRDNPMKRAFLGVGFALFLGAVPAAIHAVQIGRAEVMDLRAEQALISQKVGTEENNARWTELDEKVHDSRRRNMRTTGLLWLAVTGVLTAGWYKIT
jgi:hypothetical protein